MLHSRAHAIDDLGADLVEAVLDTVTALVRPDAIALFVLEQTAWRLVRAENVVQSDLDAISHLTEQEQREFKRGIPVVRGRGPATLFLPATLHGRLIGVLLMRPVPGLACFPRAHAPTLAALLTRGLEELQGLEIPERDDGALTSEDVAERERLIAMLVAQEWNVARVARLMGITRMTVYNRLRRLKVPRVRVRKSGPHGRRGPAQE